MYKSHWSKFKRFMKKHTNKTPYKASETHIECYVVSLHNQKLKADTIRTHLTSINNKFKLKGLHPKTDSFRLKKLLSAYEKGDGQKTTRKPITRKLLKRMLAVLKEMNVSKHKKKLLASVLTLMYSALLRVSEVTQSKNNKHNHNLKRNNVQFSGGKAAEVLLTLETYKFSKKPVTMAVRETKEITPYDRAIAFDKWAGSRKWFFVGEKGRPLTAEKLRRDINNILLAAGLKPNEYNTHSFRIGKATDMWAQGYSDAQIFLAGRWNSKAFKKYIKPQILRLD